MRLYDQKPRFHGRDFPNLRELGVGDPDHRLTSKRFLNRCWCSDSSPPPPAPAAKHFTYDFVLGSSPPDTCMLRRLPQPPSLPLRIAVFGLHVYVSPSPMHTPKFEQARYQAVWEKGQETSLIILQMSHENRLYTRGLYILRLPLHDE